MKRFDPDHSAYGYYLGMRGQEYGDYVLYTDVAPLVEALQSALSWGDEWLGDGPKWKELARTALSNLDNQERGDTP